MKYNFAYNVVVIYVADSIKRVPARNMAEADTLTLFYRDACNVKSVYVETRHSQTAV